MHQIKEFITFENVVIVVVVIVVVVVIAARTLKIQALKLHCLSSLDIMQQSMGF